MFRSLIVPVVLAVSTHAHSADAIAARTLAVGTILVETDIRSLHPAGRSQDYDDLLGKEVRRTIYAGRPISVADLGPPTIVTRNDVVTMLFRSGRMGLRTQGRSLGSAGLGESVEIMNLDSKLKVRAVVVGAAMVEVSR